MLQRFICCFFVFLSPALATETVIRAVPPDAASAINLAISAGLGDVVLSCGTYSISGSLSLSTGSPQVRGENAGCVTIHLTGNFAAFNCSGNSNPISVRDLTITGGAANFNGTINISDLGQAAVHISDCPLVRFENITAKNLSGTAFDCEQPSSAFNTVSAQRFTHLTVSNSYRAFWARNSCEYSIWSNLIARNNIFGAVVAAGNAVFDQFQFVYNYTNIQIVGQSNSNPCHGTFSNGMSNHAVGYNLGVYSCALGEDFVNVRFIGDGGGSLSSGGGELLIANSKGIDIVGGEIGSLVVVQQADPQTGLTTSAGPNKIEGAWVRNDITGWVNPNIGYVGGLELKLNFDINSGGQWPLNN